jgi:hypothetical protein
MIEELQKKQQEMMQGLMEEASRNGFTLRMAPSGMALLPTKRGQADAGGRLSGFINRGEEKTGGQARRD